MREPDTDIVTAARLTRVDIYWAIGQHKGRWDIEADAVRLRCRIQAQAGDPVYATWLTDR